MTLISMKQPIMKRILIVFVVSLLSLARLQMALADTAILTPAADTFINSAAAGNNAGGQSWLDAGTDGGNLGSPGVRRALLRFDLGSIPNGAVITSAVLRVKATKIPGGLTGPPVDSTFDLFRLEASWGEGTKIGPNGAAATAGESTWTARQLGTSTWTTPGAADDAAGTSSASVPVDSTLNAFYAFGGPGTVSDVQFWLTNAAQNFGWLLRSRDEVGKTVRGFGSRESGADAPKLEVGYSPAAGPNTPPTVALSSPADGATFTAPATLTITAEASDTDGFVTNVSFFANGVLLGSDSESPYSITADLFPGNHLLTAVAADNLGATTTSAAVAVTVGNTVITNPFVERIPKGNLTIELRTVADGMASPITLAAPDDGSDRLFVLDQDGKIWVVTNGGRLAEPLLDLKGRLVLLGAYDERGLLGLAVHPNFAQNPLLYTYTSEPLAGTADFANGLGSSNNHQSVVAEWRISSGNSNVVDVASRREILRVDQPQSNHNGGAMQFGPDGFLYITLGDGGQANDVGIGHLPGGNAQSLDVIYGKMIRIDVHGNNSANSQYGIPASNPFVGTAGLDEIYAYGLRNPFSFSFDRTTGDLWLTDVGQNRVEEINVITTGGNYGWNHREGTFWFDSANGTIVTAPVHPAPEDMIDPVAQYDHDDGAAIIGGYIYRGSAVPPLAGRYVFGDWGAFGAPSGRLYYLDETNGVNELVIGGDDRLLGLWLKGFGQDADGELYVLANRLLGPSGNTGRLLKIVAPPPPMATTLAVAGQGRLETTWTGGTGPFALQKKNRLDDPAWTSVTVTNTRFATLDATRSSGFFRTKDLAWQPPIPLTAWLGGANEVPANESTGTGLGIFSLDGNTLTFNVGYRGLVAPAMSAHIHGPAGAYSNATVLIDLAPYNGGAWGNSGTLSGVIVLSEEHKAMILSGKTYVNVHSSIHPGGEIRGQIAPVNLQAVLSGANELTPLDLPGSGLGNLTLVGNQLTFNVTYQALTGVATAAHIHGPAGPDANASPVIDLAAYHGGASGAGGSLSGSVTLTPAQLAMVIEGLTYVNVHTTAHQGGEIRGQLVPNPAGVPLTTSLSGLAERPTPLTNSASGSGTFSLDGSALVFNLVYNGLSAAAVGAHIHGPADTTANAPVLIDLSEFNGGAYGTAGFISGVKMLTTAQRNALLGGQTYVNFHTPANTGGELRGQIAPVRMTVALSGHNERPAAAATPGVGAGTFALVRDQLSLVVAYRDLLSPGTMSHIHGRTGFLGSTGVLVDLSPFNGGAFDSTGGLFGTATLPMPALTHVIDGQTYVNIHTTNYPSGEIRGHIMR